MIKGNAIFFVNRLLAGIACIAVFLWDKTCNRGLCFIKIWTVFTKRKKIDKVSNGNIKSRNTNTMCLKIMWGNII